MTGFDFLLDSFGVSLSSYVTVDVLVHTWRASELDVVGFLWCLMQVSVACSWHALGRWQAVEIRSHVGCNHGVYVLINSCINSFIEKSFAGGGWLLWVTSDQFQCRCSFENFVTLVPGPSGGIHVAWCLIPLVVSTWHDFWFLWWYPRGMYTARAGTRRCELVIMLSC